MTKQILIFIFLFSLTTTFGQSKYEPQILILAPYESKYEKVFEKEISLINKNIKKNSKSKEQSEYLKSQNFEKQPENIKIMIKAEVDFLKTSDIFKQTSFNAEQFLSYRFYERFPQLLILLSDNKSTGDINTLMNYSKSSNLQYVLNFSKIELFKKDEISYANLSIQLYDNLTNSVLIDKTYEGDWNNPGFEFTCSDSTIECSISNALSKALGEIVYIIASNNPTLIKQKQLSQERSEILSTTFLNKPFDKNIFDNIIPKADSSINTSNIFQCIVSEDSTKFVAFFLEQTSKQDFKSLRDSNKDKNINVITSKDINDDGFLDDISQTYAYIVTGVLYNKNWYYKKAYITYFEAKNIEEGRRKYFDNLQKWNFFVENSTNINLNFWETNFFSKIESALENNQIKIEELKQLSDKSSNEKDKESYQDIMDRLIENDLKNQEYFGLYEIVADNLKEVKRKQDELFVRKIKKQILNNFYESNIKKNGIEEFIKMNGDEYPLIFPSDKSVLISPVVIDYGNDKLELNYFVLLPNQKDSYDIYKWTFFDPIKPQYKLMYGLDINKQLNKITKWNFSFDTLDDKIFWQKYVLFKENDNYKYLKLVK